MIQQRTFTTVKIHSVEQSGIVGRTMCSARVVLNLKNVMITSYKLTGDGQKSPVAIAEFSLNFEEIKVTYTELKPDGSPGEKTAFEATNGIAKRFPRRR